MAVIEIAKIQMRRGLEIDIPGRAVTTSPLVFEDGLDVGEFAFATDTGRLFVGQDPSNGQPNFDRTAFPYRNVEILTEASTDTLRRIFSFLQRDVGQNGFYRAALAPNEDWADVLAQRSGTSPAAYRMNGRSLMASIDYYIVTAENPPQPIRTGMLRIMSDPNEPEALIRDDSLSARRLDLTSPDSVDPNAAFQNIEFRVLQTGTGSNTYYRFQYINNLDQNAVMYFSVKQPLANL